MIKEEFDKIKKEVLALEMQTFDDYTQGFNNALNLAVDKIEDFIED